MSQQFDESDVQPVELTDEERAILGAGFDDMLRRPDIGGLTGPQWREELSRREDAEHLRGFLDHAARDGFLDDGTPVRVFDVADLEKS
jgi:hypothetical protein